jgi:hypothetical protein
VANRRAREFSPRGAGRRRAAGVLRTPLVRGAAAACRTALCASWGGDAFHRPHCSLHS